MGHPGKAPNPRETVVLALPIAQNDIPMDPDIPNPFPQCNRNAKISSKYVQTQDKKILDNPPNLQ